MTVDKQTLDSMLWLWSRYRKGELSELEFSSTSMSWLKDFAELGIISKGTKHETPDFTVPEYIEKVQVALIQLPLSYQHIIKSEYSNGRQTTKARKLKISITHYRAKLCRARQKLRQIM